jgi:hypothetical protein
LSNLPPQLAEGFGSQLKNNNTTSTPVIDTQPRSSGTPHGLPNRARNSDSNADTPSSSGHSSHSCLPQFDSQKTFVKKLIAMNQMLMKEIATSMVNTDTTMPIDLVEEYPQDEVDDSVHNSPLHSQDDQPSDDSIVQEVVHEEEVVDPLPLPPTPPPLVGSRAPVTETDDSIVIPTRMYPSTSSSTSRDKDKNDEDEEFLKGRKISDIFCEERVTPILLTTAEISGLECMEEDTDVRPNSLVYGSFGRFQKPPSILTMPNELATEIDVARARKHWYKSPNRKFESIFRVTKEEYKNFFASPLLDPEVENLFTNVPNKLYSFSKFWETELSAIDRHVKSMERISAFQVTLLNALTIDLQPLDDQPAQVSDFGIPAACLATDMAAQLMKESVVVTHRLIQLRRQNACAGMKNRIDGVTDALMKISFESDPTLVFGGQYDKTSREAAKKKKTQEQTRKAVYTIPKRYSSSLPSTYVKDSDSSYQRGAGTGNRGAYSRGQKRKQQYQDNRGRGSASKRARGRGRDRDRGRGRGHGRGQSQF